MNEYIKIKIPIEGEVWFKAGPIIFKSLVLVSSKTKGLLVEIPAALFLLEENGK